MWIFIQVEDCIKAAATSCDVKANIFHPEPKVLPINKNHSLAGTFQKFAEKMGELWAKDLSDRNVSQQIMYHTEIFKYHSSKAFKAEQELHKE